MKAYKNVIIVGEKDTFISMTYENMYKPITYMKYNELPCSGTNMASKIHQKHLGCYPSAITLPLFFLVQE